jgi:hypothetical protein
MKTIDGQELEEDPRLEESDSEEPLPMSVIPPKRARKRNGRKLCTQTPEELGYTKSQYQEFQRLCDFYSAQTMDDLKEICKKNGQIIKGTKKDLVLRCADGKLLGALPHCPNCGQGHMRFDPKSRLFFCPGYLSAHGMEMCAMKLRPEDCNRMPWRD